MPTPQFSTLKENASLDELKDYLIGLNRYLNYLLSSLDTLNISRLDAKVIVANTITAGKLAADSVETANLQAGAVTAEKITVNELSAISADLGKLIAGILVGAYISTADGTYPRIDFSSSGNLLAAYLDATHYISIEPNVGGAPGIGFTNPSGLAGRIYGNSGLGMLALVNNIELTSLSGKIDMNAPDGISINGEDGLTGTYYVSDTSGGAATRKLTFTNGLLTSDT